MSMDYLDTPPQRYDITAAMTQDGKPTVVTITERAGQWVKFADMDMYMFEGGRLLIQASAEIDRLREFIHACQGRSANGFSNVEALRQFSLREPVNHD